MLGWHHDQPEGQAQSAKSVLCSYCAVLCCASSALFSPQPQLEEIGESGKDWQPLLLTVL